MTDLVDETLTSQRFSALVLGLFATVALTLAAVGIYSVLSHLVRGRSREIGIRTALGARTGDVLRLVVYEGMVPTLVGIGAGIIVALAFGKLLEGLLFSVRPSDPVTLAVVSGALAESGHVAASAPDVGGVTWFGGGACFASSSDSTAPGALRFRRATTGSSVSGSCTAKMS